MADNDDTIGNIPPIVPTRDEPAPRGNGAQGKRAKKNQGSGGGTGLWARLFILVSLVVAAVACAWAWQLQQQLALTSASLDSAAARIQDLEDRLSDTDEGMNQSSAAMAVKIKELYSEVDKLWASAWRRNKAKIADLEKASSSHSSTLATLSKTDKDYSAQLQKLAGDLNKLNAVAGDLERLVQSARASESQIEQLSDDLNRLNLEIAKMQKRVTTNEEWIDSINGFRKQVNRTLSDINSRLNAMQAPPAPAG